MTDRHPPAVAMFLGLTADLVDIHPRCIEIEIEMKIDVDIETPRQLKNARDLAVRIAVRVWASSDRIRVSFTGFDQKLFRTGIVEQALLGKHADLNVDRPRVVRLQPAYGIEAPEPDA